VACSLGRISGTYVWSAAIRTRQQALVDDPSVPPARHLRLHARVDVRLALDRDDDLLDNAT
jgi:hypothetical protein